LVFSVYGWEFLSWGYDHWKDWFCV
jgi:hypothetical protein